MKNNKGFSLVELIIVIAIMAVLVGVLAPTYLQYVEKSKKSNDVSTVDSIVNAIEICAIDPEVTVAGTWSIKIVIDGSGLKYSATATNPGDSKMMDAMKAIIPDGTSTKLKSSKWTGAGTANTFEILASPSGDYGQVKIVMDKTKASNSGFFAYAKNDKIKDTP